MLKVFLRVLRVLRSNVVFLHKLFRAARRPLGRPEEPVKKSHFDRPPLNLPRALVLLIVPSRLLTPSPSRPSIRPSTRRLSVDTVCDRRGAGRECSPCGRGVRAAARHSDPARPG